MGVITIVNSGGETLSEGWVEKIPGRDSSTDQLAKPHCLPSTYAPGMSLAK